MTTKKFIGEFSGDGECFCWEVDIKTYIKITKEEPDVYDYVERDYSEGFFEPKPKGNLVKLYPSNIFGHDNEGKYEIEIKFKKLD